MEIKNNYSITNKVNYIDISELVLMDKNPRKISKENFERLKKSLQNNKEFFEARPIICSNRTGQNIIIAGNQRYRAAKELGMKKVPCVIMTLSEEKEKEINIRDNVELGEWDFDILKDCFNKNDLEDWGVEKDLLFSLEEEENNTDLTDWEETKKDLEQLTKKEWDEMVEIQQQLFTEYEEYRTDILKKGLYDIDINKKRAELLFLRSLYMNKRFLVNGNNAFHSNIIDIKRIKEKTTKTELINNYLSKDLKKFLYFSENLYISDVYKKGFFISAKGASKKEITDFPATTAKNIYNKFGNNGKVLDMCAGWGGRLTGFLLSNCKEYIGYDPNERVIKEDKELGDIYNKYVNKKFTLKNKMFEEAEEVENSFDLCFTSPQYFNTELYEGEKSSHIVYDTYEKWEQGFLKTMIIKCKKFLKKDGYLILNVEDTLYKISESVKKICKEYKFEFIGETVLGMKNHNIKEENKGETFYFFKNTQEELEGGFWTDEDKQLIFIKK